jgi:hypothetical protein
MIRGRSQDGEVAKESPRRARCETAVEARLEERRSGETD